MATLRSNPTPVGIGAPVGAQPTWLQGRSTLTWYSLSGVTVASAMGSYASPGGNKTGITSYSGATVKSSGSEVFLNGGGHSDYAGNEVLSLRLANNSPAWALRRAPSNPPANSTARASDGRPVSRHTGWDIIYSNTRDRMMLMGARAWYSNANGGTTVEAFNPNTNDWDSIAGVSYPNVPANSNVNLPVVEDGAGSIWMFNDYTDNSVRKFLTNNTWVALAANPNSPTYPAGGAFDPVRNRVYIFQSGTAAYWDVATGTRTAFTFSLGNCTAVWSNEQSAFLIFPWSGTTVYTFDPVTFATAALSIAGTAPPNPSTASANTGGWVLGRFFYAPELKVCGYIHDINTNLYFFRTG